MSHRSGLPGVDGTALGTLFHLVVLTYYLDFSGYTIYLAIIIFSPCFRTLSIIMNIEFIY